MQRAVCAAPMRTPHKVANHPYTNMESIKQAYLGLLELEEEEEDEEEVLLAAAVFATSKRRHWVQPINQRRPQYGAYHHLVAELLEDGANFQRYFRMTREHFAQIHFLVEPLLKKQSTSREVLCSRQRLAVYA